MGLILWRYVLFEANIDLDKVLKAIDGRKEFAVHSDGDYISVDYHYVDEDTFKDKVRRECRGIKFKPNGELLARPYHKFFNYGEPNADIVDWNLPYKVYGKLDGSMVHGVYLNGDIRLMSRRGITDVSIQAEKLLTGELRNFIHGYFLLGVTTIFEYISPDNRIVVFYPESSLVLTAMRWNMGGQYLNLELLERLGLNKVNEFPFSSPDQISPLKGIEGVVVRWPSGSMLKIKTEEYLAIHKAKSTLAQERNAIALALEGKFDDLLPCLTKEEQAYWLEKIGRLNKLIGEQVDLLGRFHDIMKCQSRKEYALAVYKSLPQNLLAPSFMLLDNSDLLPIQLVKNSLLSLTVSNNKYEQLKGLLNGTV